MSNTMPKGYAPPFHVVKVSGEVNFGDGAPPAFCVWDAKKYFVCECYDKETAEWIAGVLNQQCAEVK